jgi:hypothetical protein
MDMNVGTWLMVAARDMPRLPTDVVTVFMAHADTPLQLQVQTVDGGASRFIIANRHEFHTYVDLPPASRYKLSGVPPTVHGYGTTKEIYTALDGRQVRTTLNDVLHAPDFVQYAPHGISKLFSQGRAQDAGATFTYADKCYMTLSSGAEIPIRRILEWGLYGLMAEPIMPTPLLRSLPSVVLLSGASRLTAQLWHRRLGHIHHDGICNTIPRSIGILGSLRKAEFCAPCAIAKSSVAARCRHHGSRHQAPFHTLNLDTWGHVETSLQGNNQFFGAFCRGTSFAMGQPIKSTGQVLHILSELLARITKWGHMVYFIRADNGATFRFVAFKQLCDTHGIELSFSAPYSPHQNALAERPWRTLAEMARCLLSTAGLPRSYWALGFKDAIFIHNRNYYLGFGHHPRPQHY